MSRTVVILAYLDCQLLDVAGPWQVFAAVNELTGEASHRLHLLGTEVGPVRTSGSLAQPQIDRVSINFIMIIFFHAICMNSLDKKYGVDE